MPPIDRYSPDPTGPMNGVELVRRGAYCNWLSRKEGLTECYEPNAAGKYAEGMKIRADALRRSGYRLADRGGMGVCLPRGGRHQPVLRRECRPAGRLCLVSANRPRTVPGRAAACCPTTWACSTCWGTCMNGARSDRFFIDPITPEFRCDDINISDIYIAKPSSASGRGVPQSTGGRPLGEPYLDRAGEP